MSVITFIGYLLTFSAMIWMVLFFIKTKGREYVSHEIKNGIVCYRCKVDIRDKYDVRYYGVDGKRELCKSCKRDESLDEVMNKEKWYHKIDLTQEKWNHAFLWLSGIAVVFNCLNIFVVGANIIGGACLFTAQAIFYFRFISLTRKKTQSN